MFTNTSVRIYTLLIHFPTRLIVTQDLMEGPVVVVELYVCPTKIPAAAGLLPHSHSMEIYMEF